MPELPEVETIKRGLSKFIIKSKLEKTTILSEKSFIGRPVSGVVTGLRRFGKALVIDLDNGKSLMIHLRMTGQLIFDPNTPETIKERSAFGSSDTPVNSATKAMNPTRFAAGHPSENFVDTLPNKQTRVILYFDNGILYFNDQRKFGFIKPIPTKEVEQDAFIKKLAPEPWTITVDDLYEKLQRHRNSLVKAAILDQSVICGLGNIYADETLFMSKIHPETRCGLLTWHQAEEIIKNAKTVMDKSIASGGSTFETYVQADGTRGDYLDLFAQVFNKTGQPCPVCGTKIEKIKVAGRGTHICSHCQTLPTLDSDKNISLNHRTLPTLDGDQDVSSRCQKVAHD